MNVIHKQIKFTASADIKLLEKTIEYFIEYGFKHVESYKDKYIKFQRGSLFLNLWTFNPLKWKSEIIIYIEGSEITADFNINTFGQMLTFKEEKMWAIFIENYQRFLSDKSFDFRTENKNNLKDTKRSSLKYVGWFFLGSLIAAIPVGLLAYWTGNDSFVGVLIILGGMFLAQMKSNQEWKKHSEQ